MRGQCRQSGKSWPIDGSNVGKEEGKEWRWDEWGKRGGGMSGGRREWGEKGWVRGEGSGVRGQCRQSEKSWPIDGSNRKEEGRGGSM